MKESTPTSTITLRDIGRNLGISHVAVSLALRNSSQVSSALRTRVLQTARQMGYRPNPMATALGYQRRNHNNGVIHAKIAWINFWDKPGQLRSFREFELYWKGAYVAAETHGYRLEEFLCGNQITPSCLQEILLAQNIHGLLIPPHGSSTPTANFGQLDWTKFCAVRFGYSVTNPAVHVVASNYLNSSLLAVKSISNLGYRRIGYITAIDYVPLFRSGYCASQSHQQQDEFLPVLYLRTSTNSLEEIDRLSAWLKSHRPDAIITDIAELQEMLKILNYRIPHDIGLAATSILDGNADAGIDQNSEEIGKAAVDTLVALVQRNQYGIPSTFREVLVTGKWVNGSTLPPRN